LSKEGENTKVAEKKTRRITLREFIENNYRLFTVIGVLGGLAALFTRLENGEYLAFITFVMLILVDWELWVAFPKSEEASVTLGIFEMFSQIFLATIAIYLYTAYPTYVTSFLPIMLFAVFAGIFLLLNRKLKTYAYIRRIAPEGKWYSSLIRGLIAGGIVASIAVLSFAIGYYLVNLMN